MASDAPDSAQADALYDETISALERGQYAEYRRLGTQLFEYSREIGYPLGIARGLNALANDANHRSEGEEARTLYTQALVQFREAGERVGEAIVLQNLGTLALFHDLDYRQARELSEQAIAIFTQCNEERRAALTTLNLSEISRLEGDYQSAYAHAERSLEYFRAAGETQRVGYHLVHVAYYRILHRKYVDATLTLHEAFDLLAPHDNPDFLSRFFEAWFILACELRHYEAAGQLLGFMERYRSEHDIPRLAFLMPWYLPQVERLQKQFSYDELRWLRQLGEELTVQTAHELTKTVVIPESR